MATGLVLMDRLSLVSIGVLLTVAGLICMALLFAASPFSRQVRWHRAGWAACGSVMAFVLLLEYRHLYGME